TFRAMSAETMKMPDPIIVPATSIVASVRVIAFTKFDSAVAVSVPVPERLVFLLTHALRLRVGTLHLCMSRVENSRECNAPRRERLDSRAVLSDVGSRSLYLAEYYAVMTTLHIGSQTWLRVKGLEENLDINSVADRDTISPDRGLEP